MYQKMRRPPPTKSAPRQLGFTPSSPVHGSAFKPIYTLVHVCLLAWTVTPETCFLAVSADDNYGVAAALDLLIDHALQVLREDPEPCADQVFRCLGALSYFDERQEFAFGIVHSSEPEIVSFTSYTHDDL